MKKLGVFAMAVALMAPVALVAAGPSGAAAKTGVSCSIPSGKITVAPGLTDKPTKNKITFTLPFTKCTGTPGITSGASTGVIPPGKPGTCKTLASAGAMTITTTIKWNNKTTSTFVGKSTTKAVGANISSTITGSVTKGAFLKQKVTATVSVTLDKTSGGCTTKSPLKKLIVKGLKPFVIK